MTRPQRTEPEPVVTGYLEHGLPAWKVTGPRGSVAYMLGGSMLVFEPTWTHAAVIVDRRASEVQAYAIVSQDDQVVKLLTEHYQQLPAGPPDWPVTAADWNALDTADLVAGLLRCRWYLQPNDTAGGWCVMPVEQRPSSGFPTVGEFLSRILAETVAREHNAFLPETTIGDHP